MIQREGRDDQCWYRYLLRLSVCLSVCLILFVHQGFAETFVRVMTYNIAGGLVPEQAPIALAQRQHPDLLLLQEVANQSHFTRLKHQLGLPYGRFASYRRRSAGVAILSRWPLGEAQALPWHESPQGKLALAAHVAAPGGAFWVCSVHLDNPLQQRARLNTWQKISLLWHELFATTQRSQEALALRTWFMGLGGHDGLLGGDFNSLPLAGPDRHLRQYFSDALASHVAQYLRGTYWGPPASPIMPRLDFLYHAPQWHVVEARVVQHKASDHFPVFAVFSRHAPAPGEPAQRQHTTSSRPSAAEVP